MRKMLRSAGVQIRAHTKAILRRKGWEVRRFEPSPPSPLLPPLSRLHTAMTALLACQDRVRVVQIGANDGRINDPLYSFLMRHRTRTEVLLIEPQSSLIPILSENYKAHPAHFVANFAVGTHGTLLLYAVDDPCWSDCVPPYAVGWPAYRAPLGVTSGDREHVAAWLRRFYVGPLPLEQAIKTLAIESMPLGNLLDRVGFEQSFDVLQVDVEGCDDEVIYQCDLERFAPKIINFEHTALPVDRFRRLTDSLSDMGYVIQSTGQDTLAISAVAVASIGDATSVVRH
jgi:FkbM family methyltransferase